MNVRQKNRLELEFYAGKFNTHALGEVIGCSEEFAVDLFFIKDLDVFIEVSGDHGVQIGWKDMRKAFRDKDLIMDNYNTYFFEPKNEEDRERGFTL